MFLVQLKRPTGSWFTIWQSVDGADCAKFLMEYTQSSKDKDVRMVWVEIKF